MCVCVCVSRCVCVRACVFTLYCLNKLLSSIDCILYSQLSITHSAVFLFLNKSLLLLEYFGHFNSFHYIVSPCLIVKIGCANQSVNNKPTFIAQQSCSILYKKSKEEYRRVKKSIEE